MSKNPKHWSLGLLESMKDPKYVVKQTENIVVIKDKYPKAKIHYLVLPHESISNIFNLTSSHLSLIEEFESMYKLLCKEHDERDLRAGFHAVPSMHRLHMHVISVDMISPHLKTKLHWNTFTTAFFIPLRIILKMLRENEGIIRITKEEHETLITKPLQCNQCNYSPKNMPQLKDHLLTHEETEDS